MRSRVVEIASAISGKRKMVDERLHLEPERVMSIRSLNPDHLRTVAEIKALLGRT